MTVNYTVNNVIVTGCCSKLKQEFKDSLPNTQTLANSTKTNTPNFQPY